MNTKLFLKLLQVLSYIVGAFLVIAIGLSMYVLEATKKPPEVRNRILSDIKNYTKIAQSLPNPWPPQMNSTYPDFTLFDQEGKYFNISDYRGRILIIEHIDMANPVSHSQSGAATLGPLGIDASKLDPNVTPIETILPALTENKVNVPDPHILYIKIIHYNPTGDRATLADAQAWANHYKLMKSNNYIVAVPKNDTRTTFTSEIIGGYQLVDKAMTLRVDSAGPVPKHDLKLKLIPLVPKLF